MSENRVVFLDIDGPMIPATMCLVDIHAMQNHRFPETSIAVMDHLCQEAGAKIVLNSTHNRSLIIVDNRPNIFLSLVSAGLSKKFFHEDLATKYPRLKREEAVEDWLARHPEVTEWIAFDDVTFTKDERLIWVDPYAGLNLNHLNEALIKFGVDPFLVLV